MAAFWASMGALVPAHVGNPLHLHIVRDICNAMAQVVAIGSADMPQRRWP